MTGLESEMEVRHITKKIADLNERLDATSVLAEPRENAFVSYQWQGHMAQLRQSSAFTSFGKVSCALQLLHGIRHYCKTGCFYEHIFRIFRKYLSKCIFTCVATTVYTIKRTEIFPV